MAEEKVKLGDLEINLGELANFSVEAKKNCYASFSGFEITDAQRPEFKEYVFKKGNWEYRDSYTGFFRVFGQEIIRLQGIPVWAMSYNGGMTAEYLDDVDFAKRTFDFLKKALSQVTPDRPFRGPEPLFKKGPFTYHAKTIPDKRVRIAVHNPLISFSGNEGIDYKNKEVFFGDYHGGVIIHEKGEYPYFNIPIRELELCLRARNCLEAIGLSESSLISELAEKTSGELFQIKNLGKTTFREIRNKLRDFGLQLE